MYSALPNRKIRPPCWCLKSQYIFHALVQKQPKKLISCLETRFYICNFTVHMKYKILFTLFFCESDKKTQRKSRKSFQCHHSPYKRNQRPRGKTRKEWSILGLFSYTPIILKGKCIFSRIYNNASGLETHMVQKQPQKFIS